METKIATITGKDDSEITLSMIDGRLTASNGDDVHPHSQLYRDGAHGIAQAMTDVEAMYRDATWQLTWLAEPSDYPEELYPTAHGEGYVTC